MSGPEALLRNREHGLGPWLLPNPKNSWGLGVMDVAEPYKFIGFGAMDVAKPFNCFGPKTM